MRRPLQFLFAAAAALLLAATAPAQKWRTERVPEAGVQFSAPDRLERLPMKLGESELYQRARLRPKDISDYVRAQYAWYCDVLQFPKEGAAGADIEPPAGIPDELKERWKELMAGRGGQRHGSFKSWLDAKKDCEIVTAGKKHRGTSKKLAYEHWEYILDNNFGPVGKTYCAAAVYDFEGFETALVVMLPLESRNSNKLKGKWKGLCKKIISSGQPCSEGEEMSAAAQKKRDKYADTPERQAALKAAVANIEGLQGWDYFTMPNYIVLYSWDFEKSAEQNKARREAEYYSERLEKMRELYLESYPLDPTGTKAIMPDPSSIPDIGSPVTGAEADAAKAAADARRAAAESRKDQLGETPYSVFRLCATYDQFSKYGQSPPGVVGWYSPASKELVVFLGGDRMMGKGATETVTYHEGWHQFADFYFHPPESEKRASLHRWFDEGLGDFFGSFRWSGGKWKYVGSKMRYSDCKEMVRKGDYVPFKDIVNWPRQKFYSGRSPYYYAQAYSMIDFMRRGQKSKDFDPRWGEVLEMYRRVALVKGDTKLGVQTAFRGFTDEDWTAFEDAWKDWVGSGKFLKGK
jgi:hypothetical protein